MPRLGGVGLLAALAAGAAVLVAGGANPRLVGAVLAGSTLAWAVGLLDDLRGLGPWTKLAGQVAAAAVSVALGLRIEFVSVPWGWGGSGGMVALGPWSAVLTGAWLVALSNAVNLLDGLDGLAAGVVAIAAVPSAFAARSRGFVEAAGLLVVVGAGCLAFLRYNFSPARIFMGDSGALMVGFAFAAAAAAGTAKGPAAVALLVPVVSLGVPLFDTAWAVVRRIASRRSIMEADLHHVHHRLVAAGRSAPQAVLMLYAASAGLGAIAVALPPQGRASLALGLALAGAAVAFWMRGRRKTPAPVSAARTGAGHEGSGKSHLRHPAGSYQAGSGYPGSRALR